VSDLAITGHDAADMHAMRAELIDVYADVYAHELDDPFNTPDRYWERLEGYASRDGFSLMTGRIDGQLIGYALGFRLPATSGWWRGLTTEVAAELTAEDGQRSFGIAEIMILKPFRRQGHAAALHHALLDGRSEARALLLVEQDNVPAQSAYRSWGYYQVGDIKPFDDAPTMHAMVLDLA
jgi:ribosomal protein S18 acetylase RimI-like enzyme